MSSNCSIKPYKIHSYLSETPTPILSKEQLCALEGEAWEEKDPCRNCERFIASNFNYNTKKIQDVAQTIPFLSSRIYGFGLNVETLVFLPLAPTFAYYPANRFHFHNISYIQAESPQKSFVGTRELYYQMAIESGADLLVAVVSGHKISPEDSDKYMHFLSLGETIEIDGGANISCIKEEVVKAMGKALDSPQVILRTLRISKKGELDREIYQILPTFEPLAELSPQLMPFACYSNESSPIPACSKTITEETPSIFNEAQQFIDLVHTIAAERNIQIDREHPMLVNCITGSDQSGMFIVLDTLYNDFFSSKEFNPQILGDDLLTQIKGRALHVSSQSVHGAAINVFKNLFLGLSERFPKAEDNTESLRQMVQTEYMKSITDVLPSVVERKKKLIEKAEKPQEAQQAIANQPVVERDENFNGLDNQEVSSSHAISLVEKERDRLQARCEELEQQLKKKEREAELTALERASSCAIA